jgi:hypothetical protein
MHKGKVITFQELRKIDSAIKQSELYPELVNTASFAVALCRDLRKIITNRFMFEKLALDEQDVVRKVDSLIQRQGESHASPTDNPDSAPAQREAGKDISIQDAAVRRESAKRDKDLHR